MLLKYLIENIEINKITNDNDIEINKIEYNSNKINENDVFVAIDGFNENGSNYIEEAILNGAKVIILSNEHEIKEKEEITYIYVENVRKVLALISAKYYGYPAKNMKIIGITGTKGKTTTAYMIRDILNASNKKCGMIGTICITYGNTYIESERTSPESLDLQRYLYKMYKDDVKYVVMEVSSHALELYRVYGIEFIIGVFTNLSNEHLDFHKTMDNYLNAKAKLFKNCKYAVINGDDFYSYKLIKMIDCKVFKYGLDNEVNVTATDLRIGSGFTQFKMYVNKMVETINVNIPGRFTAYNALAAIAVCSMLNCQMDAILLALNNVVVPGRNEVVDIKKTFTAIVDYAHNPSSLEEILKTTKRYVTGRIILVFGCGGNRDKEKRPVMGRIAGKYADFTCITTDNPRDEDEDLIIDQIEAGIKETKGLYKRIKNRKDAIKFAMTVAWKNDVVLVVGKGHEDYQILKDGKKIHFDDREVIRDIAKNMKGKDLETDNENMLNI